MTKLRKLSYSLNNKPLVNQFSKVEDLIEHYKRNVGSLPCKLLLAAGRELVEEQPVSSDKRHSKYSAKRRKRNIDMEEILIVNREL